MFVFYYIDAVFIYFQFAKRIRLEKISFNIKNLTSASQFNRYTCNISKIFVNSSVKIFYCERFTPRIKFRNRIVLAKLSFRASYYSC